MVESADMAAQVQAESLFRALKTPPGSRLWSARNYWACCALNRTATRANVADESLFEMRFGTVPQSPIPILKPVYVKTKRQDKLRPKAFPCFFIGLSANRPRDTYEVLLISGSVVHSRNVTWSRLPPLVTVSAENIRSVYVSRKEGKLNPSRHGEVEVDVDGDGDESSQRTGVQPRVTARLVAPTPAAFPLWEGCTGRRSRYRRRCFVERCHHERNSGYIRAQQRGYSGDFAMSTPPATSAGVNTSEGTASPGASVQSSPCF